MFPKWNISFVCTSICYSNSNFCLMCHCFAGLLIFFLDLFCFCYSVWTFSSRSMKDKLNGLFFYFICVSHTIITHFTGVNRKISIWMHVFWHEISINIYNDKRELTQKTKWDNLLVAQHYRRDYAIVKAMHWTEPFLSFLNQIKMKVKIFVHSLSFSGCASVT